MAIYHLAMKALARSAGRSATGGAAYRAGEVIYDIRTGKNHDYSRKRGVESSRLMFPSARSPESNSTTPAPQGAGKREVGNTTTLPAALLKPNLEQVRAAAGNSLQNLSQRRLAPDSRKTRGNIKGVLSLDVFPDRRPDVGLRRQSNGPRESRADFWNRVELHHKRGDATTCREVEIALPKELNRPQRKALAEAFGQVIADHYGVAADVSCHNPFNNNQNPHAHILLSACSVDSAGNLGKKVESLDPIQCAKRKQENAADIWRPVWEQMCNDALEKAGSEERIDHRSLEDQGVKNRDPGVHLGPKVIAFERKEGEDSERRKEVQKRQESARLYKLDAERRLREESEQLKQQALRGFQEHTLQRLEHARNGYGQVEEKKRHLERLRQEKRTLEAEQHKLQQHQMPVPSMDSLRPGFRAQMKREVDKAARDAGKAPPFEATDMRKLAASERLRRLRDQGRPSGLINWMLGKGTAYDNSLESARRELGLASAQDTKLEKWLDDKHGGTIERRTAAAHDTASSRQKEIGDKLSSNADRLQQLPQQINQVEAQIRQIEARAALEVTKATLDVEYSHGKEITKTLDQLHKAQSGDKNAMRDSGGSTLSKIAAQFEAQAAAHRAAAIAGMAQAEAQQHAKSKAANSRAVAQMNGPCM